MKDNFSHNSDNYAQFRPSYPKEAFEFLATVLTGRERVWDCATGTGQVAEKLVDLFDSVEATDLSENQLKNAVLHSRIHYSKQIAKHTNFQDHSFDCVTVGQAIHWFDFEKFYAEVRRVLKPEGLIVVLGYGNIQISDKVIQRKVSEFYSETLKNFWDAERHFIDDDYKTIPFHFDEIECPEFTIRYSWNRDQLLGYLSTWSAVKHFENKNGFSPIMVLAQELPAFDSIEVMFPTLLRIGVNSIS